MRRVEQMLKKQPEYVGLYEIIIAASAAGIAYTVQLIYGVTTPNLLMLIVVFFMMWGVYRINRILDVKEDPIKKQMIPEVLQKDMPDPKFYQSGGINEDKRIVYLTLRELAKIGTTNLIITSQLQKSESTTVDGVSEFVADGLIGIERGSIGDVVNRTIEVFKMRKTKINSIKHNFDFEKSGISIE